MLEADEPNNIAEVYASPNKEAWLKAIGEELMQMKKHNVWELVDPPKNVRLLGNRWIFKAKVI